MDQKTIDTLVAGVNKYNNAKTAEEGFGALNNLIEITEKHNPMSNSTQNDEIKQMEKAIDEGFAESEKDLKDKKTPLDKPKQNDWAKRFDENFSNGKKGGQWNGYWEDIDMFISTVKIDDVKAFIAKELADARKEVIANKIDRVKLYEVIESIYLSGMYKHDKGVLRQYMSDIINVLATLREEEGSNV